MHQSAPETSTSTEFSLLRTSDSLRAVALILLFMLSTTATPQEDSPLDRGIEAFEQERYQDAISLLKKSVSEDPTAEAYTYLGHAYYFQNEHDRAREMYQNARKQGMPENQTDVFLARVTLAEGQALKALSTLHPLLDDENVRPLALRLFGQALEQTKTYDLSAALFRQLLINDSFEDTLLEKMYDLSMKEGKYTRAQQYLNVLQQRNTLNTDYLLLEAKASLKQGAIREAEGALELARRLGRFDPELYRTLADIKSKKEQFLDAAHFYELLLNQTESPSARDRYRLGLALLETGQYNEAEPHLFNAARSDASYGNGVLRLIRVLHENRPFERVKKILSNARSAFPNLNGLRSLEGNLFLEADQPQKALNAFSKLRPNQISDRGTLYNYVYAAMQTDQRERAFELLSTAIGRFPNHKPFRTLLNRLLKKGE